MVGGKSLVAVTVTAEERVAAFLVGGAPALPSPVVAAAAVAAAADAPSLSVLPWAAAAAVVM